MNWWRKNVILLGMRRDRIITPGTAPKVLMVPLKRGDSCKTWDIPALLSFGGWCHGLQANKMADIKIILNGTCARIVWNNNLSDIALQLPGLLAAASHRKSIHLSSQASSIIHIPDQQHTDLQFYFSTILHSGISITWEAEVWHTIIEHRKMTVIPMCSLRMHANVVITSHLLNAANHTSPSHNKI